MRTPTTKFPKAAIVASVLGTCLAVMAGVMYDDSPEAWNTRLDLETAGRLLETYAEQFPGANNPAGWVTMDEFSKEFPRMYSNRLPRRDGWGRSYLVGTIAGELMIVSRGENGLADTADQFRERTADASLDELDGLHAVGDDIVLVVGEWVQNGPRTLLSRQFTTMADMRSIATAVESFAIDTNAYPLQDRGLRTLESIRHELEPIYIRAVPIEDAWGNPYLYWSDGATYVIVSAAADGTFEPPWSEPAPLDVEVVGATEAPGAEIVFANGQFTQWPASGSR